MHSEFFYIGLEAGFGDSLKKEAVISKIRQGLSSVGQSVGRAFDAGDDLIMDQVARGLTSKYSPVRKASNAVMGYGQGMLDRATKNVAVDAGQWSGTGVLGSRGAGITDAAIGAITGNKGFQELATGTVETLGSRAGRRDLAGGLMQGVGGAISPAANRMQLPPGITRSAGSDYLAQRAARSQALQNLGFLPR